MRYRSPVSARHPWRSPSAVSVSLLGAMAMMILGPAAPAATVRTWAGTSATSGNWTSADNWKYGAPPVSGDVLNFGEDGERKTSNTNNYAPGTVFSTINMFGTGYRLRGNSVTISNYVGIGVPTGTNTVEFDLSAAGPGVGITLRSYGSTDRLILRGDVKLNARTLTTDGPGAFVIGGVISGTGGIFKNNGGELSLSGLGANTFTGTTIVNAGILRLGRFNVLPGRTLSGTTAIPADLVIGSGTGGLIGDVVVLDQANQIANASDVRVNGSGSLELSDENDTIGSLILQGGHVSTGNGRLTLGANVRVDPASANSVISGQLDLGAGSVRIFDIRQGARLNVNGRISGGAGISLVKSNRGDLHLTSSNSFSGDMEIVGGTLTLAHGRALGATDGVTRLILGTLAVNGSIGIPETLVVPGPSGVLQANSGSASWLGSVVLEDHLDIIIPTNSFLTIGGQISGPAGWTKNGDGTLQFKTLYTNTYAGTGWVRQGKLIMDGVSHQPVISGPLVIGNDTDPADTTRVWPIKQNQIGDRIAVTINRSGLFQLGFLDAAVGSLGGSGHITLGSGNTLVVGKNDQSTTFSGVMDGPGNFHKIGAGTLTLTGTNAYTGTSALSAGTLVVNGSIASSAVLDLDLSIVPSNSVPAIVAGTGSVPRILLHGGGIVAPGSSLGRLTVQGELGLSNGVVRFELDGPTPGISCDQLRVNGAVQLGQSQLELSLGFSPDIGHTFMLIQNDGTDPVQGAFLGLPQGSHFSAGGMVFAIEYNGGADANDVVLTRVAAPLSGISSLTAQAEGIVLHGVGVPGCTYILEFAPYLNAPVSWTPIATNQATALGAYKLIDENPLDSQRYYRVRSP